MPTGIAYTDENHEKHGDFALLAFLPFRSLVLKFEDDCPQSIRQEITEHAAGIQARRGEDFIVSMCGQTVLLGEQST